MHCAMLSKVSSAYPVSESIAANRRMSLTVRDPLARFREFVV